MWFTSYVPPRTQHLSTMSTEHTNLPRSYPHKRVIEYEPPRSYHHMLSTIHEPTRSWHNISWSMFHQSMPTIHIDCTKLAWARSLSLSDQVCLAQHNNSRLCSKTPEHTSIKPGLLAWAPRAQLHIFTNPRIGEQLSPGRDVQTQPKISSLLFSPRRA